MGTIYTSQVRDVKLTWITGRNVAHARRTAVERALLAADLPLGFYALVKPTIGQAADLLKVCPAYVAAAKAIAHDEKARGAVISGRVPLVVAAWSESLTTTCAPRRRNASTSRKLPASITFGTS